MSKWKVLESVFGKSADDFPAIKKLLASEQAKEAKFGTNNPVFRFGGKRFEKTPNQKDIWYEMTSAERDIDPEIGKEISINATNRGPEKGRYDNLTATFYDEGFDNLGTLIPDEIIFADDAASASGKIGSKIEDALIRDRERERLFNTNNPMLKSSSVPQSVNELKQISDAPSGAPRFRSVEKWAEPEEGSTIPYEDFEKIIEEQLQGKRFFFPAKADISEENFSDWYGVYENGIPKMKTTKGKKREIYSYPWEDDFNVFFADGSKI